MRGPLVFSAPGSGGTNAAFRSKKQKQKHHLFPIFTFYVKLFVQK